MRVSSPTFLSILSWNQSDGSSLLNPRRDTRLPQGDTNQRHPTLPPKTEKINVTLYLADTISRQIPEAPEISRHIRLPIRASLTTRISHMQSPKLLGHVHIRAPNPSDIWAPYNTPIETFVEFSQLSSKA